MSSEERTGWRDAAISERHRTWGYNLPALDIDFLMLEYDHAVAMALIEYKHERALPQLSSHPSYKAIVNLGNRAGIPVFAVRYAGDFSLWKVTPLNFIARSFLPNPTPFNEKEYVAFLYEIRLRSKDKIARQGL